MTTTTQNHALRITPELMEHVYVDGGNIDAIQKAVGCNTFDVFDLIDSIDLYVDDEGAINGSPLNLPLTILAHVLGRPAALFGNAIALGVDDEGSSISLTPKQIATITDVFADKPAPEIIDQLCDTLSLLPRIVHYLRSL